MTTAFRTSVSAWQPRRMGLFAVAVMLSGYSAVFALDSGELTLMSVLNAIANTFAATVASMPVWWLSTRILWRDAHRWWFLPTHLFGGLAFTLLWYVVIAYAVAGIALLNGGAWSPAFLRGPALHWQVTTAVVLYCAVAAASYAVQATRDAQQAAALLHEAQVAALRAQLDPHLLFNTLHSLLELVRSGDSRADDAIDRFARVARYVTDGRSPARDVVPLRAEWSMVQDYIALETLRLGARLTCTFELGDDLSGVAIPALSLQPLVENAIRHGIGPRPGAGHIAISAVRHGQAVHVKVEDNGLGADATTRGSGTGLSLVQRRLQARYGAALTFVAGPRAGATGWTVCATFPAVADA